MRAFPPGKLARPRQVNLFLGYTSSTMDVGALDIRFVLLDMDGTLLDRRFDDFFWEELLPERYGKMHGLDGQAARAELLERYRQREGSLAWTDIDHWTLELGLDIEALNEEHKHLISLHPDVEEFLDFVRTLGLTSVLVTNAHPKVLALKLSRISLEGYFDRMVCSREIGAPKESVVFWQRLERVLGKDYRMHSLLVDDTERVLETARGYGIVHTVFRWHGNSGSPARPSERFPSIGSFRELMNAGLRA